MLYNMVLTPPCKTSESYSRNRTFLYFELYIIFSVQFKKKFRMIIFNYIPFNVLFMKTINGEINTVLYFFFWPLCCLFFGIQILITPLVSSKSSCLRYATVIPVCIFKVNIPFHYLHFRKYYFRRQNVRLLLSGN